MFEDLSPLYTPIGPSWPLSLVLRLDSAEVWSVLLHFYSETELSLTNYSSHRVYVVNEVFTLYQSTSLKLDFSCCHICWCCAGQMEGLAAVDNYLTPVHPKSFLLVFSLAGRHIFLPQKTMPAHYQNDFRAQLHNIFPRIYNKVFCLCLCACACLCAVDTFSLQTCPPYQNSIAFFLCWKRRP